MNKTKSSSQGWREATPRKTFSPEVQERAVRMVEEHRQDYPSQWSAIESIAGKIGCSATTLLNRLLKNEGILTVYSS